MKRVKLCMVGTVHNTGTAMGNHGVAADPDHNSEQDLEPMLCIRIGFTSYPEPGF
jgi:hypothetical protein